MIYASKVLGFHQGSIQHTFNIKKNRINSRCEKLLDSLPYYYSTEECTSARVTIAECVNVFNQLIAKINNGLICEMESDVRAGNYDGLGDYLQLLDSAQSAYNQLTKIENDVRRKCAGDWKSNLTEPDSLIVGERREEFAFIIQAVGTFNPVKLFKGPAVSAGLIMNGFDNTYKGRNIGILYRITSDNLLALSVSDSYSNFTKLEQDDQILSALFDWELEGIRYRLNLSDEYGAYYYHFDDFIAKCKKRCKTPDVLPKDYYNEILLQPDFENDVVGVAYRSGILDSEAQKARVMSEFLNVPLIEFNKAHAARIG